MSKVTATPRPLRLEFMDGKVLEMGVLVTHESRDGHWFLIEEHREGQSPRPHHFPTCNIRSVVELDQLTATPTLPVNTAELTAALKLAVETLPNDTVGRKTREVLDGFRDLLTGERG